MSSNGIYVDNTPPVLRLFHHLDMTWEYAEPSLYQSSNDTIVIQFEGKDEESSVCYFYLT